MSYNKKSFLQELACGLSGLIPYNTDALINGTHGAGWKIGRTLASVRSDINYQVFKTITPISEEVPIGDITLSKTYVDPTSSSFDPYTDVVKGTNLLDHFAYSDLRLDSSSISWYRYYNYYTPSDAYAPIEFMIGVRGSNVNPESITVQLIISHGLKGVDGLGTNTSLYFITTNFGPSGLYIVAYMNADDVPISYFLLMLPDDSTEYVTVQCLGKPNTSEFPFDTYETSIPMLE